MARIVWTARQKDDRVNETSIRLVDSETRAPLSLSSPERALSAANLPEAIDEIKRWATEQGLRGATARDLFEGVVGDWRRTVSR
jgi:hypothetical protein